MNTDPMLPKLPESLIEHIIGGRCVLFAGAGLSVWGKLPTWKKLLLELVKKVAQEEPNKVDENELVLMIQAGKLLEVAEYCKERLGPRLYSEVLTAQLRSDNDEIPAPHKIIAELPFAAIVTTNYDKLLEQSYIRLGRGWPKAPTHKDTEDISKLLFESRFFILKAHGDIDRADSLILTTSDYRETISSNPAFSAIFSALLITKAILFVGYSLTDPDFRILMDRQLSIFRGSVPERYALMSDVGSIEGEILWRTARIRVLRYANHADIPDILESLRQSLIRGRTKRDTAADELFGAKTPHP